MERRRITPIISVTELATLLTCTVVIIFDATNGGKEKYLEEHINGAHFIDLNSQLSQIGDDPAIGGRHPLPTPQKFADILTEYGVTKESHIVVYDNNKGANAAARLWWMLKSAGHDKVQVLNGGLKDAIKAYIVVNSKEEQRTTASIPYYFEKWNLPLVFIQQVHKLKKEKDYIIIDVRDKERYEGRIEPIDKLAGHIPGAVNIPFAENLTSDGYFQDPGVLKEKYGSLVDTYSSEKMIIHCGSGVTACHTILAMDYAGLDTPNLYVGSWSEWSRNYPEEIEKV